jgi:hypothetical protein
MIKSFLIFGISIITSIGQLHAHVHENNKYVHGEHNKSEERIQHYQVDKPQTDKEALAVLENKSKAIENKLLKKKLSSEDLEEIHETTYWLEASVDLLKETKRSSNIEEALDKLDEAVQAVHYSSENHKEIDVREWQVKLKSAIVEVNNVL